MKKLLVFIILMLSIISPPTRAQVVTNEGNSCSVETVPAVDSLTDIPVDAECSLPLSTQVQPYSRKVYFGKDSYSVDTLCLPRMNYQGFVPLMSYPYDKWWGMDNWQLHKGLNVSLGVSVFGSFGKGAPKGAGFGQDLSLMYAMPLSGRLSLAIGGWINNAYWAHDRFTDAGFSAVLGYRFDEHWEAYVYGRKSIMNKPVPYCFRSMQELGDRIGASVKYNFSPSFSVQVSVSTGRCELPEPDSYTMRH